MDRNLELTRVICAGEGNRQLVFKLLEDEVSFAKAQLAEWGIHPNDFLVCLHPGGSSFDKQWPSENYARLADWLISEYNAKILILRGPERSAPDAAYTEKYEPPVDCPCAASRFAISQP